MHERHQYIKNLLRACIKMGRKRHSSLSEMLETNHMLLHTYIHIHTHTPHTPHTHAYIRIAHAGAPENDEWHRS